MAKRLDNTILVGHRRSNVKVSTQLSTFGRALKEARTDRLVSQTELAEGIGVNQSTVSSWESGVWECQPPQVFALESFLDLPPGDLSRHLGYLPIAYAQASQHQDADSAIRAMTALDSTEKHLLITVLRGHRETKETLRRRRGKKRIAT